MPAARPGLAPASGSGDAPVVAARHAVRPGGPQALLAQLLYGLDHWRPSGGRLEVEPDPAQWLPARGGPGQQLSDERPGAFARAGVNRRHGR